MSFERKTDFANMAGMEMLIQGHNLERQHNLLVLICSGNLHSSRQAVLSTSVTAILSLVGFWWVSVLSSLYFELKLKPKPMILNLQCQQRKDTYGAWEHYLGLEHTDNAPKRSHQVNQVSGSTVNQSLFFTNHRKAYKGLPS